MPKLTIEGVGTFDVEAGTRLANAIVANGTEIGHRCGGQARCTTCRVTFTEGEPEKMTVAERDKLAEKELTGQFRLACQITVDQDMTVATHMTLDNQDWSDAGPDLGDDILPAPEWV